MEPEDIPVKLWYCEKCAVWISIENYVCGKCGLEREIVVAGYW